TDDRGKRRTWCSKRLPCGIWTSSRSMLTTGRRRDVGCRGQSSVLGHQGRRSGNVCTPATISPAVSVCAGCLPQPRPDSILPGVAQRAVAKSSRKRLRRSGNSESKCWSRSSELGLFVQQCFQLVRCDVEQGRECGAHPRLRGGACRLPTDDG